LRFTSLTSAKTKRKLELLAKQIRDLISAEESIVNTSMKESEFPPDSVLNKITREDTQQKGTSPTQSIDFLPSLDVPLAQEENGKEHLPQQVTVILRSTGNKQIDRQRIKTIYGTLISFHGRDHFSFHIFEGGKGYLIDFPDDTTRLCNELLESLRKLMGEENWRVEEITFG
jgi:hypothetical protein